MDFDTADPPIKSFFLLRLLTYVFTVGSRSSFFVYQQIFGRYLKPPVKIAVYLKFFIYFNFTFSSESLMTTYMICNLIGMSSTCTNPILYGFLTQNIQEVLMHGVSVVTDKICYCLDGFKVSLI